MAAAFAVPLLVLPLVPPVLPLAVPPVVPPVEPLAAVVPEAAVVLLVLPAVEAAAGVVAVAVVVVVASSYTDPPRGTCPGCSKEGGRAHVACAEQARLCKPCAPWWCVGCVGLCVVSCACVKALYL